MAYFLSPVLNEQQFDANGDPLAGGQIYTYLAGTTTPVTTYKTSTGTAQTNPIVLDSSGNYPTGTQLWLDGGFSYKFVIQNSLGATLRTIDNITGVNDANLTPDEWTPYTSSAFTYLSATSFSVVGDQTNIFQVDRRVRTQNTGGLIYSTIFTSIYSAPNTTITLVNDSGVLDAGLSAVSYALLSSINPSLPKIDATYWQMNTNRILGRTTASNGAVEELQVVGAELSGGILTIPADNATNGFRLTLTSGTPVTTTDVTGATTIYCTPYQGNSIALYSGSAWVTRSSAEFSLALGTLTSGRPYDVFCYDNAGTPTLEFLAWSSDTARATALTYQDGVLVKSGDATRRYLGSFRTVSTTATEDSIGNRYLFNYYNRVTRPCRQTTLETTASWTYTTATWRQANANANNQFNVLIGWADAPLTANVRAFNVNGAAAGTGSGVGIDSTSTNSATLWGNLNFATGGPATTDAIYRGYPSVGKHTYAWLEISQATSTTQWFGQSASGFYQAGISGEFSA